MAEAGEVADSLTEGLLSASPAATGHVLLDVRPVIACSLAEGGSKAAQFKKVQRRLLGALFFCVIFMFIEVIGGFIAHSLAIMTDAAHMLADVSGFGVSLFAGYIAARRSQADFSYGYHRIEVLGALASTLTVWLVTGILVYEAVMRIITPEPVDGRLMFFLALAGVLVNVINFFILGGHGHLHHCHGHDHGHGHGHGHGHEHEHEHEHGHGHAHEHGNGHAHACGGDKHDAEAGLHRTHSHGEDHAHKHNLNLRGAIVHVIGDLVQSIGVALAGALIWWKQDDPRFRIADPICTFLFAFLTLLTTRAILIDVHDILMERVPRRHSIDEIATTLSQVEGVLEVHDLHVWSLTPGIPLLAAHVYLLEGANASEVLPSITGACRRLGIEHTTIQLIIDGRPCPCHETPDGQRPDRIIERQAASANSLHSGNGGSGGGGAARQHSGHSGNSTHSGCSGGSGGGRQH